MSYSKSLKQKNPVLNYLPNDSASQVARDITPGCRVLGLTRGQFSLIDLIYSILNVTGKADVICVTWSAGIKDVRTVEWMLSTTLINSFLLVTDHSFVTRKSQYVLSILDFFGKENIRTSEIHAKFCLISNDNYKIVIRTSMNLNANKTCENFEIDDCIEIYDFYKKFVDELFGNSIPGFNKDSLSVNRSLDVVFNNIKDPFKWQSNE